MIAYLLLRTEPHYRHDSFAAGLRAAGYDVTPTFPKDGQARHDGDVMVIWNRYGHWDSAATRFAAKGGLVLVAENGLIGKDGEGRQFYQICRHFHAGHGSWHVGEADRWAALGIELEPWRAVDYGQYVLICEQRSIGVPPVASPHGFAADVARKLEGVPFRIRYHPATAQARGQPTLEADLAGARCVVVWTSTAGILALVKGIPVIYCARHWIAEGAATDKLDAARRPELLRRDDSARLDTLKRLAWAQWTVNEIATGRPFRYLSM